MKRLIEDTEIDSSSSRKHIRCHITCFLDLSDEILVCICRYLSQYDVLYSFYTPENPQLRLHHLINDYYKKLKLNGIRNNEFNYFSKLFCDSKTPLRPESLILSNEQIYYLIQHYSDRIDSNILKSIFNNLKSLKLIDCLSRDLYLFDYYYKNLTQLNYLHITIRCFDQTIISKLSLNIIIKYILFYLDMDTFLPFESSIYKFLFKNQINSLQRIIIQYNNGICLYKSLIPNQYIEYIDINLQTIDDLYILLNGLIPNVKTMIIQLCQTQLSKSRHFLCKSSYSQLTEFTLLEPRIGLIISDIKCIFSSMPNLIKLTLSIRDTPDPIFCQGPKFESILNEYLPNLRQFDYTMTHRINDKTLIENFIRWPMNFTYYSNENCKWIHIYSLPWPENKNDRRQLPIIKNGSNLSVTSDVKRSEYIKHIMITKHEELNQLKTQFCRVSQITTCLSFNIELPSRIYKLILLNSSSINEIVQPTIRHLIVKHRLNTIQEISNLAHQFPHVKYLELLLPEEQSSFINCLKKIFSLDDKKEKLCFWSELINFNTSVNFRQFEPIYGEHEIHLWFIKNTDLKYVPYSFHVNRSRPLLSIWF